MKDKPFALLAINTDSVERFRKSAKANKITWPNIWDGGNSGGPIARAWGINSWPSVFVIDEKGIIRHDDLRSPALDEVVDKLVEGLE